MDRIPTVRVMMIGPFPVVPTRMDGGVAAALTYLARSLVCEPAIELIGVRIRQGDGGMRDDAQFGWPVVDLPLGRMSLSSIYRRQKRRFHELIREFRPDIVHAQGTDIAGYLATDSGMPAVVTVHGLLGECAKLQSNPATRARSMLAAMLTERRTIRRATDIIAISPYVLRYYRDEFRGKAHEIPNAVAPRFFEVERDPQRGWFLYAGRIANGKGLVELLHAAANSGKSVRRLVLAGATPDPSYGAALRELAGRLGLEDKVIFAGLLDESALVAEFGHAEALVLPSHQETAPMVIQQAMAAGLAVLATRVGGVPDQVSEGSSGMLFDAGNIAQLTTLLGLLGSDPTVAPRLGTAARSVAVEKYQSSAVARSTAAVYRTVLAAGRASA